MRSGRLEHLHQDTKLDTMGCGLISRGEIGSFFVAAINSSFSPAGLM